MVTAANWVTSDCQVDDLVEVLPDPVAGGAEVAADLELKLKTFLFPNEVLQFRMNIFIFISPAKEIKYLPRFYVKEFACMPKTIITLWSAAKK